MALYLRNQTWWAYLVTPSGEKIRRSTKTQDKKEAQKVHDLLRAKLIESPKSFVKGQVTLSQAAERWIEETTHKATHERDKRVLAFFCAKLGNVRLCELTNEQIRQTIKLKQGKRGTINCYLAILRAVLRRAERVWEVADRVPAVRLLPDTQRRIRYLTTSEAQALLRELPEHLHDMVAFSLMTGLRKANVVNLRWEQVDLQRGMAWIHPDQSKNKRAIGVPLNRQAIQLLQTRWEKNQKSLAWVFYYRDSKITQVNTKAFRAALKRAGIKDFRWHDLRHTFASWHIQAGTPPHVLQELGGWSSYEMVRRYAHLSSNHLQGYASQISLDVNLE